jgi:hypothetical protein
MRKKILFIGGSLNQTTMMHQIASQFKNYDCYFTPYYADGIIDFFVKKGWLNFTILAGKFRQKTEDYLTMHHLNIDYKGEKYNYDLVFTCQDLIVPKNIKKRKLVLVQEGMTDPENLLYYMVKYLGLPRWIAGTSTTGLSAAYDLFFVASEGYKDLFIKKGVNPSKIYVTGIPNFDNVKQFVSNNFSARHFVLAATSDRRETLNYENRKQFIHKVLSIANGRQVIFKLHPNENWKRAKKEIKKLAPAAMVLTNININHLIANCDVLVTRYSSVVYVGMALGKEVYSDFDMQILNKLTPIQNNGESALKIARIVKDVLLFEKTPSRMTISAPLEPLQKIAINFI